MKVSLSDVGKRFNREWIFRHLNYHFEQATSYAITGPNGSGKSTLLQIIAGAITCSEGKVEYDSLRPDEAYRSLSIAAPYLEVIEEMTLQEFLHFHKVFKPFIPAISVEEIMATVGLQKAAHKQIRYYSSGMKQRVKLAQAIFSDTSCLLLDEPCTNLDEEGIQLYHRLIHLYCKDRLVIVSSNDEQEYSFCKEKLTLTRYQQI